MVDTDEPVTERLKVSRWNSEQLQALGFDESHADLLANSGIDWHDVEALIAAGCPVELAEKIVL